MAYGAIWLPSAIWSQFPPGAQSAITIHNNTIPLTNAMTEANMHTAFNVDVMNISNQQATGLVSPTNNQSQQVQAQKQVPGTTLQPQAPHYDV